MHIVFDFVISGDELKKGEGKPDPASFQRALQRMNLTPSEAIVVENSPLGILYWKGLSVNSENIQIIESCSIVGRSIVFRSRIRY